MRSPFSNLGRDVQLGIKNLLLHKLRSFLTMLGLVFGVGSVIAMLAIGEGASQEALEQIRRLGSHNIILRAAHPASEQSEKAVRLSVYGLEYEDADRIRETFPHVEAFVPVKAIEKEARYGARALDLRIVGTTEKWFELVERDMMAGRALTRRDYDEKASVAVLTDWGARRLLATGHAIGDSIVIGGNTYEIVGIVRSEGATEGSSMQAPDQATDAYIPLSTARERYGDLFVKTSGSSRTREQVQLHQILVRADSESNVEAISQALTRMLEVFHKKKDWSISVPLALLRQAEQTKRTFSIVLGAIAGISLLVGGIGIMNIMLASVTERTREIGIRRAIGARRAQIVGQFLIESLVLSALGGCIGIALGLALPWIVTKTAGMPTVVTPMSLILSLGISVAVGMIFGIYPAMRAAKLDPIVALRHD